MNLNKFKQLIKECVREVIHEEMGNIQSLNENRTFKFSSDDVHSVGMNSKLKQQMDGMFKTSSSNGQFKNLKVSNNSSNPFAAFIDDAAENMTAQDRQGLRNLD